MARVFAQMWRHTDRMKVFLRYYVELPFPVGEIDRFRPGIGMIGSRLDVPVVPVRIRGLDQVLHPTWRMARPGRVRVAFGAPMRLKGEDYEALAKQVEDAVRNLP